MCHLLRSSLIWSRFVADERTLTLNVPMVKFEWPRPIRRHHERWEKHGNLLCRELHLVALLMCVCTARVHPYRGIGHHRTTTYLIKSLRRHTFQNNRFHCLHIAEPSLGDVQGAEYVAPAYKDTRLGLHNKAGPRSWTVQFLLSNVWCILSISLTFK